MSSTPLAKIRVVESGSSGSTVSPIKTGEIKDPLWLGMRRRNSGARNCKLEPISNNTNKKKSRKGKKTKKKQKNEKDRDN